MALYYLLSLSLVVFYTNQSTFYKDNNDNDENGFDYNDDKHYYHNYIDMNDLFLPPIFFSLLVAQQASNREEI